MLPGSHLAEVDERDGKEHGPDRDSDGNVSGGNHAAT
jgi:hypothetical protein